MLSSNASRVAVDTFAVARTQWMVQRLSSTAFASSSRLTVYPRPFSFRPAARLFSSFSLRALTPSSVRDPEPQSGIYYHPTTISVSDGKSESQVKAWALSFLKDPPTSTSSSSIIAFLLPPKGSSDAHSTNPAELSRADPDRIRINSDVWKKVHQVLKEEVVPHDDLLQFEADTRKSGWAHLTDLRHPLMPGRIATPENIIASVAFVDGIINTESYEANASYRLVTGYEGPIQLPDSWMEKIRRNVT